MTDGIQAIRSALRGAQEKEATHSGGFRSILPAPRAPSPAELRHRRLGKPKQIWTYFDRERRPLLVVARFEPETGQQELLSLTYGEERGREAWWFRQLSECRPLYGLNTLAQHPAAPVLVVGSEKAADAAAALFVDHVATTSLGGVVAADKADWTPLRGRRVVVWPDMDEAGARYGEIAARAALAAGASAVAMVAVPESWPKGWDLAGIPPQGVELRRILEAATPFRVTPVAPVAPKRAAVLRDFAMRRDGLWFVGGDKGELFICDRFEVLAETRDENGKGWGLLLGWNDSDGRTHEEAIPAELLASEGAEVRRLLADGGLRLNPMRVAKEQLQRYLSAVAPPARAWCVPRIGWHRTLAGEFFALPGETLAAPAAGAEADRVVLQAAVVPPHGFAPGGTLDGWQREVAALCAGNSRLILAVSMAFAAPLLMLAGDPSGGLHLRGGSSTGKTTALRAAASVMGGGGDHGGIQQWRSTANGLESVAAGHCDSLLCLDELAQVDAREAGETVYLLGNGAGKARADRGGGARRMMVWRVLFLSTGEIDLADKIAEAGQRQRAGQEVRIVDVPADAGAGHGLFETLHDMESPAELAEALIIGTRRHFGTAGREFLAALMGRLRAMGWEAFAAEVVTRRRAFVAKYLPPGASGQVGRVVGRFGLVAVGGELATEAGITGWAPGDAEWGAAACLGAWLERRGTVGQREPEQMVEQVRAFILRQHRNRFELVRVADGEGEKVVDRVGFRERVGLNDPKGRAEGWHHFLPKEGWAELCRGFNPRDVAAVLAERGFLARDGEGKLQVQKRIPNLGSRPTRLYHLLPTLLDGEPVADGTGEA